MSRCTSECKVRYQPTSVVDLLFDAKLLIDINNPRECPVGSINLAGVA